MSKLVWDETGEKIYETGVSNLALYVYGTDGYGNGVAWNGVTSISETPAGAEVTPVYADNTKYLNMTSLETFGGTIEAYMYPDEFKACDGSVNIGGMNLGQQKRKTFGLAYKTIKGNDTEGEGYGYKLHLVYGCLASPSSRSYSTTNESPEAITFSWEFSTTPVNVTINGTEYKPTSIVTIDSDDFATPEKQAKLKALEDVLFGTESKEPKLPTPSEVYAILNGVAQG